MEIAGKVALVTGAGSGIGRATAQNLAARGAKVVLVDLNEAGLKETERSINEAGGEARTVKADVTHEGELHNAFLEATNWGDLKVVFNNAGVGTGRPRFPDAPSPKWRRTIDVDLMAVVAGCQIGIQAMRDTGGGVIINTASMAGLEPFPADIAYAAAKGGVVHVTRSLAPMAEQYNIRVNCVCPGIVDTPMVHRGRAESADEPVDPEMRRIIESLPLIPPQQVADAVLALIEDDSLAGRAMRVAIKGNSLVDFPHLAPMAVAGRSVAD